MNTQELTTGGYHQPRRVHLKTEANLMTGRSKTIELLKSDTSYRVTLSDPANTMRFSFSVRRNAEKLFKKFNIDKE